MSDKKTNFRGFHVGDIYYTKHYEFDDTGTMFYPDTEVRLTAITPKVRIITGDEHHDSSAYFANCETENGERLQINFCCLKKTNQ